jgi:hypothetical protein
VLDLASVELQLLDVLAVLCAVGVTDALCASLGLSVFDSLLVFVPLSEAVVLKDLLVACDRLRDFVSAGVAVAVPATLLDSVSLRVWLKLAEALAVPPGVGVADKVMLELLLELPVWEAVAISVPDLVLLNDELMPEDELRVGVAV